MNAVPDTGPTPPSSAPADAAGMIVVGVDGSEPSREALRWAYRQATLTGAHLRVVMSWDLPATIYLGPFPEGTDFQKATEDALDQTLDETLGNDRAVSLTTLVLEGHPAPVLLQQANEAELLVVGSRGHGEFTGMLLGSVSEHCVTHATCPVVVVRTKPAPTDAGAPKSTGS